MRGVLRRAADSWLVIGLLAGLFAAGFAGSTWAYFDGSVTETATYQGGTVAPPLNQVATASGNDGVVTWTPPAKVTTTYTTPTTTYSVTTVPGVQGQRVVMMDNATSTDCSAVTYTTTLASGLSPTVSVYTDTNRSGTTTVPGPTAGDQYCYAVESYWTPVSWYQRARAAATQLGLVVDSIVIANHTGTANKLDVGDTITLTFNQKPATPANGTICTFGTGEVILVGDATCSNLSSDPWVIGKFTGYSVGGVGHQKRSATVAVSSSPPWTMTVTVTQSGQNVTGSGSFTPSPSIVSAATTDQATVCQSGSKCLPSISGSF